MQACLGLGVIQWVYSAALYRRAVRRLLGLGARGWPAASVVIECAGSDDGARRSEALRLEPYPGELDIQAQAAGTPLVRALAAASPRAEVLVWVGPDETPAPGWLERRLARLPTHAVEIDETGLRLTPIKAGWAGFLQLAGLRGTLPRDAILAYLPAGVKPDKGAAGGRVADFPMLGAKNLWALAARFAVWGFLAAAAAGAAFNAYFLLWALRPWPWIHCRLLETVAAVSVAEGAVLAVVAWRLSRIGATRCVKLVGQWLAEDFRASAEYLGGLVAADVPVGSTVLDVGACHGMLAEYLRDHREARASGIDVVPMSCSRVPVAAYDGETIPAGDGSVDVALTVYTLHHCRRLGKILGELRRVTKGRLIVVEDSYETLFEKALAQALHLTMRIILGMPWEPRGFGSERQWRSRLEQAGFRVLECRKAPPSLRDHFFCRAHVIVAVPRGS